MKPRTFRFIAAVSLLVAACGLPVPATGADGNVFSGRVVDADGNPIPDVEVVAWSYALADGPLSTWVQWETTSAPDGTFTLRGLGPGANNVVLLKDGFLARSRSGNGNLGLLLFPRSAGAKEGVEICMERPEFVSGTVVDESGNPIAGAEVNAGTYTTTTAADGSFKLPAAVAESVAVTAPGYYRPAIGYEPDEPEPWTITLKKAIVISGRVLDAATGKPVEGAHLFYRGTRTKAMSGPDGRYRLDQVAPGRTDVLVWKDDLIAKVKFEPYDGMSLDAADIRLRKGGTIEGHVTDEVSGQPLDGVPVSVWEIDPSRRWLFARQTTTGPDGRYRITGVLPGNMNVVADDFRTGGEIFYGCVCAHIEPGEIVTGVDFQIDAPPDPGAVPRITGRVLDDKGDPLPSAMLYLFDHDEPDSWKSLFSTDITGEFSTGAMTYSGQPSVLETNKPYDIVAYAPPLAPTRVENVVIPGATLVKQLTITLHNGARVTGTVRDLDGQPIADITLLACAKAQAIVEGHKLRPNPSFAAPRMLGATTAQDGTYEMPGLAPGTWLVGIFPRKCQPTSGPHEIQIEGETPVTDCDFTARALKTGAIEGTVVDENGAPLPHAEVKAHCREPVTVSRSAWTDAQGRFRLQSLPEVEYKLRAEREDGYLGMVDGVEIGASDIAITARFNGPPKTDLIHGRVVNAEGKPISQFDVKLGYGFWSATYHSPSGKFAALMTRVEEFSVSAPGYETKTVNPDDKALHGAEILIVLEREGR